MMKFLVVVCALVHFTAADMYLHNPPGSNDRNRERNDNRNNANRLFDSQNNAAGGYPWRGDPETLGSPDPITYYVGSKLRIEWANQHGCGPNVNVFCNVVIQYACEDIMPGLRDGYPMGTYIDLDPGADDAPQQYYARRYDFNQNGNGVDDATRGTDRIPNGVNDINQETGLGIEEGNEAALQSFYSGDIETPEGKAGVEYGMHEDYFYYQQCSRRQRNKGLYLADQNLNGNDARYTRQNNNANRHGLECTEERDYYPYWAPAPWKDIAILPPNTKYCDYYQSRSRNTRDIGWCMCDDACRAEAQDNKAPIAEAPCLAAQGNWVIEESWGLPPPDCKVHGFGADNHLGMAHKMDGDDAELVDGPPNNAYYMWTVPKDAAGENQADGQMCVLRLRYNISTADYIAHPFLVSNKKNGFHDARFNCPNGEIADDLGVDEDGGGTIIDRPQCSDKLEGAIPLYDRPYITVFEDTHELSIAQNTDQIGRTFQDRTHVFRVAKRPGNIDGDAKIWNLNSRGRRGNIVQAYPSTEYIFAPDRLVVDPGDYIHIQLHGSDFNAAKNPNNGEGWRYSDRFNMIELQDSRGNFPKEPQNLKFFSKDDWKDLMMPRFDPPEEGTGSPYVGYDMSNCVSYKDYNALDYGNTDYDQVIVNCGKMNHAGNILEKAIKVTASDGEYFYVDTRNNNFSNRSHKGCFVVDTSLGGGAIAGIVVAAVFVVGGITAFAVWKWKSGGVGTAASV